MTGEGNRPAAEPSLARTAVAFTRLLRSKGVSVGVDEARTYTEALQRTGLTRRRTVYWVGRATLVPDPRDVPAYDAAFEGFWDQLRQPTRPEAAPPAVELVLAVDDEADAADPSPEPGDDPDAQVRYSRQEVLRDKDFADCTSEELREAYALIDQLRRELPRRRSRRAAPASGASGRIDLRRTVRRAQRTAGEPLRLERRSSSTRPRRVVLLCDVSGSMDPYARALVRFLHTMVVSSPQTEAFALGTRLTRLTRSLRTLNPDVALHQAAWATPDWSGGTQLGHTLRAFNDRWGVRGLARGAVVVLLSDGWDRGEPDLLSEQLERLRRVAHRIVWVNPLKGLPEYAPLARGMAAALPHVDDFREGHSVRALEALAEVITSGRDRSGPRGRAAAGGSATA